MTEQTMNLNDLTVNINLSQRTALVICLGVAALACLTFGYAACQWRSDWILVHQASTEMPVLYNSNQISDLVSAIPDEHLFGTSKNKLGNMPITNLQLRVTGIVKVDTEQLGAYSKAYISIAGQPSKIYQVGDVLPYGVKVYDITSDAVILENDGHLEKLPLPREQLKFKPKPTGEN